MIVDVTPGWDCTQATATAAGDTPNSDATAIEGVDDVVIVLGQSGGDVLTAVRPRARGVVAGVFAAQHAAAQRAPRRNAESELLGGRYQLALDGSLDQ